MINKETAAKIFNCHNQIEHSKILLEEMKKCKLETGEVKLEDAFGGRRDLELGVPSGRSGHRILNVEWSLGMKIIKQHIKDQKKLLIKLNKEAELELTNPESL